MKVPQLEFRRGIARRLLRVSNMPVLIALISACLALFVASYSSSPLTLQKPAFAAANLRAPSQSTPGTPNRGPHSGPFIRETVSRPNPAAWMRFVKAARQKALYEDTDKLLKLATELNSDLSAPNASPIDNNHIRKVTKIEKLARQVERDMSGR